MCAHRREQKDYPLHMEEDRSSPDGLPQITPDVIEQEQGDAIDNIVPTRGYQMTPMVALGGSAGSITAMQAFFRAVPPDSGMVFVVIIHLAPNMESNLPAILSAAIVVAVFVALGLMLASNRPGAGQTAAQPTSDSFSAVTPAAAVPAGEKKTYTAPPPMTIDPAKNYTATITTSHGDIVIKLRPDLAPQTVNSFVFLGSALAAWAFGLIAEAGQRHQWTPAASYGAIFGCAAALVLAGLLPYVFSPRPTVVDGRS